MLYPSSERLCASVATAAGVATGAVLRFAALLSSAAPWLWERERLWTPWAPWTLSPWTLCSAFTFSCVGENVSRLIPIFAAIFRTA